MSTSEKGTFVSDIEAIRQRAGKHIENGAVTDAYRGDRETVIKVLNEALATELVCVLRYKRHHYAASGIHAQAVADEFLEHAKEEQEHADMLAERITQLGGDPDFNPETLTKRSHRQYVEGKNLSDMIREDLVAERIAIESYSEIKEHAEDLKTLSRLLRNPKRGRAGSKKRPNPAGL